MRSSTTTAIIIVCHSFRLSSVPWQQRSKGDDCTALTADINHAKLSGTLPYGNRRDGTHESWSSAESLIGVRVGIIRESFGDSARRLFHYSIRPHKSDPSEMTAGDVLNKAG